jgi:alpha-galactosidase/6-phospho-beta-glucosidase family protein
MIVEAGLAGDPDLAIKALINDPLCSHLSPKQVREMGMKLLKVQEKYMPQFSGRL